MTVNVFDIIFKLGNDFFVGDWEMNFHLFSLVEELCFLEFL